MNEFEPKISNEQEEESQLVKAAREIDQLIIPLITITSWPKDSDIRERAFQVGESKFKVTEEQANNGGSYDYYRGLEITDKDGSVTVIHPEESMITGRFGVVVKKDGNDYFNSFKEENDPNIEAEIEQKIGLYITELKKLTK